MKQRPILFNTEMVQAILAGRKTQTRRVVKPPKGVRYYFDDGKCVLEGEDDYIDMECPYGERGDILWVRETWCLSTPYGPEDYYYGYKAGDIGVKIKASERYDYRSADIYRPSIHMPKDAARIWLRIKDVRVERLQDISNEDIRAEGAAEFGCTTHRLNWQTLWESVNGSNSWKDNPFVWVIEFERIEKP
jgi:hypothetical protein